MYIDHKDGLNLAWVNNLDESQKISQYFEAKKKVDEKWDGNFFL